ncbi:MAG: ABC transporter permease [Acidobacteria bacterium]|nr:ABC transporter permease [Acidobacteriota bacterium]
MGTLNREVEIVLRCLFRRTAFTTVAVLTLALGVGVNTAIFSIVKAVLLNPPPYSEPERLILGYQKHLTTGQVSGVSLPNYFDWRAQSRTIESLAAMNQNFVRASTERDSDRVLTAEISAEMWDILGAKPVLGRVFTPEEQVRKDAVAVVSHSFWEQMLDRDPKAVGKQIRVNKMPITVVGVLPPNFRFPYWSAECKVLMPLPTDNTRLGEDQRSARELLLVGRLRRGVSFQEAQSDIGGIAARLAADHPRANAHWAAHLVPMQNSVVEFAAPILLLLFVAAGLVLLIACINVAHLFVARTSERAQELAIRLAIGATRQTILRMLVIEGILISLLGCGVGVLLASWVLGAVLKLGANMVPRLEEATIDATVFGFAALLALLTGLVFAGAAAFRAAKTYPGIALNEASSRNTENAGARRMRKLLVVSEIALSIVILIAAGFTVSSFRRVQQIDPGFDIRNILTLRVDAPLNQASQTKEWQRFYDTTLSLIEAVPDVKAVSAVNALPLGGGTNYTFKVAGSDDPLTGEGLAQFRTITPNYFQVLSVPMRHGRSFTSQDHDQAPRVVIVNETLARRFFPNGNAVGEFITLQSPEFGSDEAGPRVPRQIVGIVADIHETTVTEARPSAFYVPYSQTAVRRMRMVVRPQTKSTPQLAAAVRSAILSASGDPEVLQVQTVEEWLGRTLAPRRFNALLMAMFAVLAILLAAVGAYAIMAQSVTVRAHEFGIRMGLGASGGEIRRMVFKQAMFLSVMGAIVGSATAYGMAHYLQKQVNCACTLGGGSSQSTLPELMRQGFSYFLGNLQPDVPTVGVSCGFVVGICLIASWLPARRASRVDPVEVLRRQ